jgi:hypothetical protein
MLSLPYTKIRVRWIGAVAIIFMSGLASAGVAPSNDECSDPIVVNIGSNPFTNEDATA